ncbi:hypothetical protein [Arthrobacter globiformis]|uniref:hypothetical protein n=1 Tax=Arthrobacter globiformis TaxID=1665 RepID=UPI000B4220AC|nr:hypothetical protein [Arthrobacter globiformis]
MDKPLNVVVLVGSTSVPEQVFRSAFGDVPPANVFSRVSGRAVTVSLVAQLPAAPELELASSHVLAPRRTPLLDRLLAKLPVARLEGSLRTSPLGRLLLSLGPTDPSKVYWRAVRADPQAMAMLSSADVLLAADLPAVRTAWHFLHSGRVPSAYFGLQAAEKVFAARFKVAAPAD